MSDDPMIRLEGISKRFPGSDALAVTNLDIEIPRGEIVMLIGPSGCGKTTTLKMINRLIEPTSGRVFIDGAEVTSVPAPQLRRSIGYVIQQTGLFPHKTVAQNIGTVPRLLGWEAARIRDRVDELIDLVDLDRSLRDRYASELSGGQRQRVGVARALAADPPVLLMDEPFGAVDPIVRGRLQRELLTLQDRVQKTIVFVTHDIDEAILLGDRVAILNVGGRLEQYGPPESVLRGPANPFVEDFLGGERGLKRLGLMGIPRAELIPGPVIGRGQSPQAAVSVAEAHGSDWVGLLDDRRLVGWVWLDEVRDCDNLATLSPRPFRVTLDLNGNLRQALDAIVSSQTQVAVVLEGDRYAGMLDADHLNRELLR